MSRPTPLPVLAALLAVLLVLLAADVAAAQGILRSWRVRDGDARGAAAGDVDGDGTDDYALGERGEPAGPGLPLSPGRLRVLSGGTGEVLLVVDGSAPNDGFGTDVAGLGDVDGDGRADVAVSAPADLDPALTGFVRLLSGADGGTLWEVSAATSDEALGTRLARLPDLDGDGAPELAVTSLGPGPVGTVRVLSGADGALRFRVTPPPGATNEFGAALADARDFDGDGLPDLAVGDPLIDGFRGRVLVYSGRDGALLASYDGPPLVAHFGASVAGVEDLDGDGVPELLVGSPAETTTSQLGHGRARLLSGATGDELLLLHGGLWNRSFGEAVAAFSDLDGDVLQDLAVSGGRIQLGCCVYPAANLRVHSSADGALLYAAQRQATPDFEVVPDADGGGTQDFFLPRTSASTSRGAALAIPGLVPPEFLEHNYVLCPPKTTSDGCSSYLGTLGAPSPTQGDPLVFRASSLPAGTLGFFAWSTQKTSIPFGDGVLCLAPPVRRSPPRTATLAEPPCSGSVQPTGHIAWVFPDADLLALGIAPGETFYVQVWFRDPGFPPPDDVGLSGAIEFTLWP